MVEPDDEELLRLIERDPEGGIAQVIERYGAKLKGRLRRHAWLQKYGYPDVDDVWITAIEQLLDPEYRTELRAAGGQILPYLSRWGYWRLDDAAALRRGVPLTEEIRAPDPKDFDAPEVTSQQIVTLRQVFPLLSPRDRMILRMRYEEGQTEAQVAELLSRTEGAIKKAAHDARKRLKKLMIQAGIKLDDGGRDP